VDMEKDGENQLTQKKTNTKVLEVEQVEEERAILKTISNRKKTWLAYIMRQGHGLLLDIYNFISSTVVDST